MSGKTGQTEADGIRLRPMQRADRELIRAIEDEPAGNAMANVLPRSPEAFAAHWERIFGAPDVIMRIIEHRSDGDWYAAGFVTSFVTPVEINGDAAERTCVGYRLGERWWGRGIMSVALRVFLETIVTERPLWAVTAADNPASQRVLTKCGFGVVALRWTAATARYPAGDEVVMRIGC